MISSLRERIQSYQDIYDGKFLPKLPIIISINGRSFKKATKLLQKPFDKLFIDAIEAINVLIHKQQQAMYSALNSASYYELLKHFSVEIAKSALQGKSAQDKSEILAEKCGINFDNYDLPFVRGYAIYRAIRVVN